MKFGQAGEERSIFVSKRRYDSRYKFGTTEREKKGALIPKRHQTKHLEFVLPQFWIRGSEVQILPLPDQIFLSIPQSVTPTFNSCREVYHFPRARLGCSTRPISYCALFAALS